MTDDVVAICAELIALDTSNFGRNGCVGERPAAEYILERLPASGFDVVHLESAPTRSNVVVRVPGLDRNAPALLVHGHLDVVPAEAADWTVPPFAGEVRDGYVWGRGAVDMKDMVAMMVATLLDWAEAGTRPQRDIVFAFVADEEENGEFGAEWLVREHPALFAGVEAAIGEAGGAPIDVDAADGATRRFYPVAVAERGSLHMRVDARGTAGHGSRPNSDNPVTRLVHALSRVAEYEWPLDTSELTTSFLSRAAGALGVPADVTTPAGVAALLDRLGRLRDYVEPSLRCSATPTVLDAGYKVNVVPAVAHGELDVRSLPGTDGEVLRVLDKLLGDGIQRTMLSENPAIAAPSDTYWFRAIEQHLSRHYPDAIVLPFCMGGGTDAKPFAKLGIAGYGFAPLAPDPEGRFGGGMHGVDERVPVASLVGGQRLLSEFLEKV